MVHVQPIGGAAGWAEVSVEEFLVDIRSTGVTDVGYGSDLKVKSTVVYLADFCGSESS